MNFNIIMNLNDWDIEESDPYVPSIPKGDIPSDMDNLLRQDYIGQTVRIKPGTRYWVGNMLSIGGGVNPRDTDGIITRFEKSYEHYNNIQVSWSNGYRNCYKSSDLIII